MKTKNIPLLLAVLLCFSGPALAGKHAMKEITATKVSGNIYMISHKGGNIGLFTGPDGTFMIDDQFAPVTNEIIAAIKKVGGDAPRFPINTHYHGDHTGGNENIGKMGATIVSHHNVRRRLVDGFYIAPFKMKKGPAPKEALPVITFTTEGTIE